MKFIDAIIHAKESGVSQVSFRNIVAPPSRIITDKSNDAYSWIVHHKCQEIYDNIVRDFRESAWCSEGALIRVLPFGAQVYDVEGIAVTMFDECVQHSNHNEDIRSLIYQEDGHMYTSWDSPASILF